MVAITNNRSYGLMTLSSRFTEIAGNVVKASTSGIGASRPVGTTMEGRGSFTPSIQPEGVRPSAWVGETEPDLGQEIVRLNTTETHYEANLKVVAARDDLLGTVLDILA